MAIRSITAHEMKKGGGEIVYPHLDTIDCGFTGTQRPQAEDRCLGICSAEMNPYPIKTTQIQLLRLFGSGWVLKQLSVYWGPKRQYQDWSQSYIVNFSFWVRAAYIQVAETHRRGWDQDSFRMWYSTVLVNYDTFKYALSYGSNGLLTTSHLLLFSTADFPFKK